MAAYTFVSRASVFAAKSAETGLAALARKITDPFTMKLVAIMTTVASPSPAFTEAMRRRAPALSVDFDDIQYKAAGLLEALRTRPTGRNS